MTDIPVFSIITIVWALGALPTLVAGLSRWDPVGRLAESTRSHGINGQFAWFLFELPALITFPVIYWLSGNTHLVGNIVVVLWLAHYVHRSLIWCWFIPKRDTTVSWTMCFSSIGFNLINGALLGWFMSFVADYAVAWLTDPRFITGAVLMVFGAALNVWGDYRLKHLRDKAQGERVMPSGGVFNYVCCPNLAGEIIEWLGFALLTWCLPAVAFALWTIANLVPRAVWRRDWYREHFEDFPTNRAALMPRVI